MLFSVNVFASVGVIFCVTVGVFECVCVCPGVAVFVWAFHSSE